MRKLWYTKTNVVSYPSSGFSLTHDPTNSFTRSARSFARRADRNHTTNADPVSRGGNIRSRLPTLSADFPPCPQPLHAHACRPVLWRKSSATPRARSPFFLRERSVCSQDFCREAIKFVKPSFNLSYD